MKHFLSFLAVSTTLGAGTLWADLPQDEHKNQQRHQERSTSDKKTLKKKMDQLQQQMQTLQAEINGMKPTLSSHEAEVSRISHDMIDLTKEQRSFVKKGGKDGVFVFPGSGTTLGINGYLKGDVVFSSREYNPNNPNANSLFYDAPLEGSDVWKGGAETHFLVKESRLNLTTETPTSSAKVRSRLEVDFYGSPGSTSTTPRIRHALISWTGVENQFWLGHTFTNFDDGRCTSDADLLDFFGIAGVPGGRAGQIGWKRNLSSNTYIKLATEFWGGNALKSGIIAGGVPSATTKTQSNQPVFVGQIGTEKGPVFGSISIFGGRQTFIPTGADKQRVSSWGVSQSLAIEVTPQNRISYDVTYGLGLSSWLSNDQGFAQNESAGANNRIQAQRAAGFGIAYTRKWNEGWRSTLGLGTFRIFNRSFMTDKTVTRWIRDAHVNTIMSPVKNLDVGLEYAAGQRCAETLPAALSNGKKRKGIVHRVQFSAKWWF